MSAVTALLARIVDYAGLFPPAELDMEKAVLNYHRYLDGDQSWMLGSFVLPAARLIEFTKPFESFCCTEQEAPWTLSVVCAGEADAETLANFQQGAVFLSSFEVRAADASAAEAALRWLPQNFARYVEFPPQQADAILPVLAAQGARAKLRTGGVTPDTIPSVETVAQFMQSCARQSVAWKATAGLHHAVRRVLPLSADANAGRAPMHGFINLFVAGALVYFGVEESSVIGLLSEADESAFQVDDDVIRWREHTLTTEQIEQVRRHFAISFGSCSFDEPVQDLKAMEWL